MKSKTKTLPTDAVLRDMLKQAGLNSAGVQFRLLGDGMFNAVFAAETNPPVVMKIAPRPQVPVMTYERDMLATELYWYDQIRQHTEITVPDILYSDPAGNLCGRRFRGDGATARGAPRQVSVVQCGETPAHGGDGGADP